MSPREGKVIHFPFGRDRRVRPDEEAASSESHSDREPLEEDDLEDTGDVIQFNPPGRAEETSAPPDLHAAFSVLRESSLAAGVLGGLLDKCASNLRTDEVLGVIKERISPSTVADARATLVDWSKEELEMELNDTSEDDWNARPSFYYAVVQELESRH